MHTLSVEEEEQLLRVSRNISKELGITNLDFNNVVWGDAEVLPSPLSTSSLEQLSRLIRVYKALHVLFKDRTQANTWLHRQNEHFENNTALEVIYSDPSKNLQYVAEYLEQQLL